MTRGDRQARSVRPWTSIDTGPKGLTVSADGKYVYVTGVGANSVAVLGRNSATGMLTFVESVEIGLQASPGYIRGGPGAVRLSPDGGFLVTV